MTVADRKPLCEVPKQSEILPVFLSSMHLILSYHIYRDER